MNFDSLSLCSLSLGVQPSKHQSFNLVLKHGINLISCQIFLRLVRIWIDVCLSPKVAEGTRWIWILTGSFASSSSSLGLCKAGCITSSQASPDETDDGSTKNYGCNTSATSYNSAIKQPCNSSIASECSYSPYIRWWGAECLNCPLNTTRLNTSHSL